MVEVRDCVKKMQAYIPGASARNTETIKLNQNENRYPPSAKALSVLKRAAAELALYPDSSSTELREAAAKVYGVQPEEVMAANGSDEMLRMFFQTFCDQGDEVVAFYPSYTYYETLAAMQNVKYRLVEFNDDFSLPSAIDIGKAKLLFLPNPNAPTGKLFTEQEIRRLVESAPNCMVVVDEAYIDFSPAGSTMIPLIREYSNLAVTRTFSKSYALAGLRAGLGFARQEIFAEMEKIRDYYNLDRLTQAVATEALLDQEWLKETCRKIMGSRERTEKKLAELGLKVYPSQANFVLADCGTAEKAGEIFRSLGESNILVRYFRSRRIDSCLRITIGTDNDMDMLFAALEKCV